MKKIRVGILIVALFIPVMIGVISGALTAKGMATYGKMAKPPLSPPAWVFPVAWTLLYIMMGLASYFVIMSEADSSRKAIPLLLYVLQLVMNFMWSIIFFNWGMYMFAFIWLLGMWCIVIIFAIKCFSISRLATVLLIPYILWLTFAGYLNMGAYVLKNTATTTEISELK